MKQILFFVLAAFSLRAQPLWHTGLQIADTSLWSTDLVRLPGNDLLLLGRRELHHTDPGIPIEGYPTYGSYLARLDGATGEIEWEQRDLSTGFLNSPSALNVQGRLPAPTVLIDSASGAWILPYTVYVGILTCSDPNFSAFSTAPGLLRGSLATGAVLSDTVYQTDNECGIENVIRSFRQGSAALMVTQQQTLGMQLLRFSPSGALDRYPFANGLAFIQDATQDPATGELLALGDNAQGQPVVVRTDTLGMELQTYPLAQVLFRLQALPGGRYLGWGPRPVGDSVYSALYHYDGAFHVLWSYQTLNTITAAATTTSGSTTFVLEGSLSGLDQNLVRVVRLDAQGTAVGDRDYPGADLWPGSLLAGGDSCYVFSSTTFDLFEHPEPAVVGVTADCLAGTSAAPEPPDFGLALSLLPNPATEQVAVRWGRTAPAGSTLVVYDATGRALQSHPVGGETGLDLPVGGWPAGLYVVMLRGNGWEQSVRGCLIRG